MFGLSPGEIEIVLFVFALVWGAGQLPKLGERLGGRLADRRARERREEREPGRRRPSGGVGG